MVRKDIPLQNLPDDVVKKNDRLKQYRDLVKVARRAQHILTPNSNMEFVWVCDGAGAFEEVVAVSVGRRVRLKKGSRVVKRTKELDVSEVLNYPSRYVGLERMVGCIRRIFFTEPNNIKAQAERFFDDDRNFNMVKLAKYECWYK
jgi:hypothetical protein